MSNSFTCQEATSCYIIGPYQQRSARLSCPLPARDTIIIIAPCQEGTPCYIIAPSAREEHHRNHFSLPGKGHHMYHFPCQEGTPRLCFPLPRTDIIFTIAACQDATPCSPLPPGRKGHQVNDSPCQKRRDIALTNTPARGRASDTRKRVSRRRA